MPLANSDTQTIKSCERASNEDWQEDVSLLSPTSGQFLHQETIKEVAEHKNKVLISLMPWIINVFLAIMVVYIYMTSAGSPSSCPHDAGDHAGAYSPAEEVIEYVPVNFRVGFGRNVSPYQGWPTDEKDELWQELYSKGATIGISKDAHERLLNKTERVPILGHENDYVVGIDVFHQLHCLNMIRMGFYPRRYNVSMVNPDGTVNYGQWLHIDHCIESIRESLMCSSDISINAFQWLHSKIMEPQLGTVHMCRNFSKIRDWTFDRWVNLGNKRLHVENDAIVDYSGWGQDPEEAVENFQPKGWNFTADDL